MNEYHVLLVEDDSATRTALQQLFAHKGWIVSFAKSVGEAVEKLDPPPHCIILDLMLPDGPGEIVLRKVREGGLSSKVAVCTGTSDEVRLALVRGLNPDSIFRKPVRFEELLRSFEADTDD